VGEVILALKNAKIKINNLDRVFDEILEGAKTWRYLLYGYDNKEVKRRIKKLIGS